VLLVPSARVSKMFTYRRALRRFEGLLLVSNTLFLAFAALSLVYVVYGYAPYDVADRIWFPMSCFVIGTMGFMSGVTTPIPDIRIKADRLEMKILWRWHVVSIADVRCHDRPYGVLLQSMKLPLNYLVFRWSPYASTKFMSIVIDRRISNYEVLRKSLEEFGCLG
jgi:hypothetical protein